MKLEPLPICMLISRTVEKVENSHENYKAVYLCFRFDCGSGVGVVRSEETVVLNEWNHLVLYRHRWEAWIQLNKGKHVLGRSKVRFPIFDKKRRKTNGHGTDQRPLNC